MALTLTEAAYRSNDKLQVGIIEKLVYEDPILQRLQFKDIVGNGLTYNVEATMSGARWYDVNEVWVESTSTVDQTTAVTHILGGDADVDRFLQATRSDQQDLMTEQIEAKIKAIKKEYMEMFWYGYYLAGAGLDAKGFDGLHYLIRSTTSPYVNAFAVNDAATGAPAPASLKELEQAVDSVKNGTPDLVVMTKQCKRNLNAFLNAVGGLTKDQVQGKIVQTIFGYPIATSDYLSDDEACDSQVFLSSYWGHDYADGTALGNDDNSTTVFALRFAPEAVCGIQSGGTINAERLGSLETKDAERVRIKWYPGLMLQSIITAAKYSGISNAAWTAV